MTFTVTYRDKSGQRVQEAFEAESRSELFAQLKERKINALRIDSGKPKVTRSSTVAISPKFLKLIAALLAVAVCAVVVITLLPTKNDVKNVEVVGNNKISSDKIIELSGINDSINLFKLDKNSSILPPTKIY